MLQEHDDRLRIIRARTILDMLGERPATGRDLFRPLKGLDNAALLVRGGRVLDGTPATAEVLPDIVSAVGDEVEVLVDGGIRSGLDVFRAIALGARACLVCRPFVVAAFGGGERGVRDYLGQLRSELTDAMEMCGTPSLRDISREALWDPRDDR